MVKNYILKLYYILLPILIIGVSLGYTSFAITMMALVPLLFLTNCHTVGVFLLMYGGPLGGIIRALYPFIPIYGIGLQALGLILIWDLVLDLFRNNLRALGSMLMFLAIFGFFYLHGPMTDFATNKYVNMCVNGILMVFGYYTFERSCAIDVEGLTRLLLLASICMFTYAAKVIGAVPGGLFNYDWFREQFTSYLYVSNIDNGILINYQHIGILVLFAASVYLSQINLNLFSSSFYIICISQLVLTSGCKQAIIGVILVVILRLVVFKDDYLNRKQIVGRFGGIILGLVLSYFAIIFVFQSAGSDLLLQTLTEGDVGRQLLFAQAIEIFRQNPLFGIGLGGFYSITGVVYPHNLFMELLSECGIVGFILLLGILIIQLVRKNAGLLHLTSSNLFYFVILIGLFTRVMVSSDLTESIELFSAVCAISTYKAPLFYSQRSTEIR